MKKPKSPKRNQPKAKPKLNKATKVEKKSSVGLPERALIFLDKNVKATYTSKHSFFDDEKKASPGSNRSWGGGDDGLGQLIPNKHGLRLFRFLLKNGGFAEEFVQHIIGGQYWKGLRIFNKNGNQVAEKRW